MPEQTQKQRRWGAVFTAICVLLMAQVTWWTWVFYRDVDLIKELKIKNHWLEVQLGSLKGLPLSVFEDEAFHRRFMFISEGAFFAAMACLALWLLYRALRSEEKSREVQRNFIEVVSHESKTPLTALKLRLEAIAESNPEHAKDIHLSLEEVRRLSSILEKALQLNRLEKYSFTFEQIDLALVVQEVLKRMEPVFSSKKVAVTKELQEGLLIKGDVFAVQNTVQTLLENSVLYNESENKELRVEVRPELSRVILSVSDNGPGISEKESEKVFERFYRGRSGRKVPGTGLGLYIARAIVQAHQGVIRLIRDGAGAHFEIEFPLTTR